MADILKFPISEIKESRVTLSSKTTESFGNPNSLYIPSNSGLTGRVQLDVANEVEFFLRQRVLIKLGRVPTKKLIISDLVRDECMTILDHCRPRCWERFYYGADKDDPFLSPFVWDAGCSRGKTKSQ